MKKIYLLFVLLAVVFVACKKDKEAEISTLSIKNEKIVSSSTSMELSCEVICATPISKLYLQYSAKSDFSKYDEVQMAKEKSGYSVKIDNLIANTTYYVRYLAVNSYSRMMSEKISKFKTQVNSNPDNPTDPSGREYVDLGLSVKWATYNVGATKPEEYGDYFAWGETEPKTTYNWDTYKYCKGTENTLTKYCSEGSYGYNGFTDNKTVLDPEDDAATVNWGGVWRMPTKAEQDELRDNCTWWTWTTQNGVNGYKVVGPNGNSIFLPAAGSMYTGSLGYAGSGGYYWSSSLYTYNPNFAYYLQLESDGMVVIGLSRSVGRSVRPVWGERTDDSATKNQYTITVTSSNSSYGTVSGGGTYEEGAQVTLTATANLGYKFKQWNDGNTENPRVITVTKDATYAAQFEKFEPEYVDLGLPSGLKWATCNIGATRPEEYGDYFAWGEIEQKKVYDWRTYKYGTANNQLTKYCVNSHWMIFGKDGFIDDKIVLDPEDDVATINWGEGWRMPLMTEQDELRNECTWTWEMQKGVNGYKVTGKNGNSIFLPAAGFMNGMSLENVGSSGYYWSSSLYIYEAAGPDLACTVDFDSNYVLWSGQDRIYGLSVRPIFGERKKEYKISVYSNNSSYGTVYGGGTHKEDSQVILEAIANSGYKFKQWDDGSTENPRVITVTQDATYSAYFEKFEPEYVDLGLPSGLKWATCNVGATKPEEYGDYFAWGEVTIKDNYDWTTYKYCKGTVKILTKYCGNSDYGNNSFTDNKTVLDPEDDAASVNWGGNWRMPTDEEVTELRKQCTWTWATQNGVNGSKVVGPNGNFIFLPAAGYMGNSSLKYVGESAYYWLSSHCTSPSYAAYGFGSYSANVVYCDCIGARNEGMSVRPVYK